MCWITNSTKRKQRKIEKSKFQNFILKYDVIHDALKLVCNKNLRRPRNFGDMGFFGDICAGRNLD